MTNETIGARLHRLRVTAKLSQRDVADLIDQHHGGGISYAYLSRIESGDRDPSIKAIRKIAAALNVHPDYLEAGRTPIEVVGPLTDRLVRDLLAQAREAGIKGRRRVRVLIEEVPA